MSNRYSNSIPLAILEQLERRGDHDDIMETPMNDALHREAIDRLKRGRACLCCDTTIDEGAFCIDCSAWIGEIRGKHAKAAILRSLDLFTDADEKIQTGRRFVWDAIDQFNARNATE